MLETFTLQTFTPLLGSRFELRSPDGSVMALELIEANAVGGAAPNAARDPFSLVFRAAGAPVLGQGTYRLAHVDLDVFDLFIVPIRRDAQGTSYEAVFA